MSLDISEIFYSIQGESTHSGRPCAFVRLTGCNLRCSYCDTQYAYSKGEPMEISAIVEFVAGYQCSLVEITGGEPLLQQETPELIIALLDAGHEVLLETNGSMNLGRLDRRCVKIMDIKCPSSNAAESFNLENLNQLGSRDQVKFVIQNRGDYEYAKTMIPQLPEAMPGRQILFSPVTENLAPRILAKWILSDHLNVRLQLQLHKILWPELDRGV